MICKYNLFKIKMYWTHKDTIVFFPKFNNKLNTIPLSNYNQCVNTVNIMRNLIVYQIS